MISSNHLYLSTIILILACGSGPNSQPVAGRQADVHKITVEEVLQSTKYTYLRAKEVDAGLWLAVSKSEATAGEVYYYKGEGGLPMTNFTSKELNRTFEKILFLDKMYKDEACSVSASNMKEMSPSYHHHSDPQHSMNTRQVETPGATAIITEQAKGGITIAELFKNKKSYSGKTVIIKGQVVKFIPAIMNKNWLHIQDGTEFSGKFDLTVTTGNEVKVGDTVTLQGVIALDKDFGFGYFYEVIMEDAKLVK